MPERVIITFCIFFSDLIIKLYWKQVDPFTQDCKFSLNRLHDAIIIHYARHITSVLTMFLKISFYKNKNVDNIFTKCNS